MNVRPDKMEILSILNKTHAYKLALRKEYSMIVGSDKVYNNNRMYKLWYYMCKAVICDSRHIESLLSGADKTRARYIRNYHNILEVFTNDFNQRNILTFNSLSDDDYSSISVVKSILDNIDK